MNLPMIPRDKANHALYGAALAAVGGLHSVALGALLCAAGSIGWEVAQRLRRQGTPSVRDALTGIAGGALVLLPLAAWRLGWVG